MNSEQAAQILLSRGWIFVRLINGMYIYRSMATSEERTFTREQLDLFAGITKAEAIENANTSN